MLVAFPPQPLPRSSLHPSICELHYPTSFLSHYLLIMHMWLVPPFRHSTAAFPSASHLGPPFPPSPFKAPVYKSHHAPMPLSLPSSIYASHYIITDAYLCVLFYLSASLQPHQTMCVSLRPLETFMFLTSFHVGIPLPPLLPDLTTN